MKAVLHYLWSEKEIEVDAPVLMLHQSFLMRDLEVRWGVFILTHVDQLGEDEPIVHYELRRLDVHPPR